MSKSLRRGCVAADQESVDRRKWYQEMQSAVFAANRANDIIIDENGEVLFAKSMPEQKETSGRPDTLSAAPSTLSIATGLSIDADETDDGFATPGTANSLQGPSPDKKPSITSVKKEFKSFALVLAEESEQRAKEREERIVEVDPPVEPYVHPSSFQPTRWLNRLNDGGVDRSNEKSAIIVCFHGIGGSPNMFRNWSHVLEPSIYAASRGRLEMWAVCLPGRLFRTLEEPMECLQHVAESVVQALVALSVISLLGCDADDDSETKNWKGAQLFFVGHDLGGALAFETARLLRERRSIPPLSHLVISSVPSPIALTKVNRDRYATKFFCASERELIERVRKLGGIQGVRCLAMERRLLKIFMPLIRADYKLLEKYRIRGYFVPWPSMKGFTSSPSKQQSMHSRDDEQPLLDCAITCIMSKGDIMTDEDEVRNMINSMFALTDMIFLSQYICKCRSMSGIR